MQFRCRQDSVKTDQSHIYYFCGRVGGWVGGGGGGGGGGIIQV